MTNYERVKATLTTLLNVIEKAEVKHMCADMWNLNDSVEASLKARGHEEALQILNQTGFLLNLVKEDIDRAKDAEGTAQDEAQKAAEEAAEEEAND